ncbi:sensor histidine kinase [Bifidobacterium callimiconis]|uniref:histidine kinase n=1 Tax=Bifidobacterium callimiconis TaxID=2306973 RepID=A0A430FGH8_9BIFI|nr:HAMP domain-containing sensor histidine kinase [Bifidobacterium callimiconis]MBT1176617.1 HAMP domain-containing histidine kinase [Bifidobacterium callimiconis]RSX51927.1 two-component system sensor histidine kinase [Bifidobacterium callimiconis]
MAVSGKRGAKAGKTRHENPLVRHLDAVSLSTKLVSIILVLLLVSGGVIAFAVRQLVSAYIVDKTDNQLTNQAGLVINNIDQLQHADNNSTISGNLYFVQFRDADYNIESTPLVPKLQGSVVSIPKLPASGSLDGIQFGQPFTTDAQVQVGSGSVSRSSLKVAMSPWRVVALQYTVKDPDSGDVVRGVALIGLSLHDMQDTLGIITKYFLVVGIATIVFATVMATIAVDRTLLPLKRIEKTAAKIANGDLSQRVPSAPENTEVGSLSASLNQMLARIEQSFREQRETTDKMKRFVSDASHELRTPLAAIHGYAELYKMQRDYPGALERADESIDRIEKSSTRMAALVEDLLSLARMDEGRGIDLNQKAKLNGIVADSAEDLHALDPERAIRLGGVTVVGTDAPLMSADGKAPEPARLEFQEGKLEPITIQGDPARLRQVITNIVGNIHRYTPEDSPVEMGLSVLTASLPHVDLGKMPSTDTSLDQFIQAVQVASSTGSGQRFAVMQVVDHGPGMAPQSRQMIFERFYTADPSRAREKGGTGLGMAIAQSAVKAHHGLICASETTGGGLTFTVIIPIQEEPQKADTGDASATSATANPSESVRPAKA